MKCPQTKNRLILKYLDKKSKIDKKMRENAIKEMERISIKYDITIADLKKYGFK